MRNSTRRWLLAAVVAGATALPALALEVEAPERRIVVSIPDRMLALTVDGRIVRTFPIAVGTPSTPSPAGEFRIIHRIPHPTYYQRKGQPIPPGERNPLGTRWLGLSKPHYGIHGTNEPDSIGQRASGGCIRLRNTDVEELFELIEIGDVVELHGERNERVAAVFGFREPVTFATEVVVALATAPSPEDIDGTVAATADDD